jgi:alpha-L-arabinofuranosidase
MIGNRREVLKAGVAAAVGGSLSGHLARCQAAAAEEAQASLVVNPAPLFDLSPYLYMQFMEPLGTTDSSVEAAWSYDADDWRRDFVDTSRDLAPPMMRFGGLFSRYYKWRVGVGPGSGRPWMRNYLWGGKETHRVGTGEFVEYCRKINAEPLYCVNFRSDGRLYFAKMKEGDRTADAAEAAAWVSYCNDPEDALRKSHGVAQPYGVRFWQLGNETSYGPGGFTREQSIEETIRFARAMRERDRPIKLLGWGDAASGRDGEPWAGELARRAGEHIDYVAFHMMQQTPMRKNSVLNGLRYQRAPQEAWEELMEMVGGRIEKKLVMMEQALDAVGSKHPLAITEGHLSLAPRNVNPILSEWLTGVYTARAMNLYQRHGDRVKIATAADFCGDRWTTNALILQVPGGISYLLPAGAVMRLFRRHSGPQAVAVKSTAGGLDVAGSREGNRMFLHVANTDYARAVEVRVAVEGMVIDSARVHEIAPEDPRQAVTESEPEVFKPKEREVAGGAEVRVKFGARSVSVVEIVCRVT